MADPIDKQPESSDDQQYVVDPDTGGYRPYKIDKAVYDAQTKARHRESIAVAAFGIGGEIGQYLVGLSSLNDPVIKDAQKELSRLEAKAAAPVKGLTDIERANFKTAVMAPVIATQNRIEDQAKNIAASVGDNSARTFLKATEAQVRDIGVQAINAEAQIAKIDLDVKAQERLDKERAREAAKSIKAMMFKLREERVREPIHQFLGNLAKNVAKVAATAPAPDYKKEMSAAIDAGADVEDVKKLKELEGKLFGRARMRKQIKGIIKEDLGDDPKYMAGLDSKDRERLEAQQGIKDAETATELSRYAMGVAEAGQEKPVIGDSGDDPTPFDVDDSNMTEAQRREMAGLDAVTSDPIQRKDAMREAMGRTFMYTKPDSTSSRTLPNTYTKGGKYTYVYNEDESLWQVFEGDKKLDYELPIAEAAASNDPGEMELYALAARKGLLDVDNSERTKPRLEDVTVGEPAGDVRRPIEGLTDTEIENVKNVDTRVNLKPGATKSRAGLEIEPKVITERKAEAKRMARGGTFKYTKVTPLSHDSSDRIGGLEYEKGEFRYVYEPKGISGRGEPAWYVFKNGKKLDYELSIADAEASNVPGEMELYELALRDGLIDDKNTDTLTGNMRK